MNCPVCGTALELRVVAPCMDCGARAQEIDEWREGAHKYAEFRILGLPIVLCDFCDADFPSYRPDYLGIRDPVDYKDMERVRPLLDAPLTHDQFCPRCKRRLAFLNFLIQLRAQHAA